MDGLSIVFYDVDAEGYVRLEYYEQNGRFYRVAVYPDGSRSKIKRVSERDYLSAVEQYHNA